MAHRVALTLIALVALTMIGASLLWPRGMGRPLPPPFDRVAGDTVPASR